MNRRQSIKAIRLQIQKLEDVQNRNPTWVFQTGSYIKEIFGEDSVEYHYISQFSFAIKVRNDTGKDRLKELFEENVTNVSLFLNNCIETVNLKGITKKKIEKHTIKSLSAESVIGLVGLGIALVGGAGSLGYYFGLRDLFNISSPSSDSKQKTAITDQNYPKDKENKLPAFYIDSIQKDSTP